MTHCLCWGLHAATCSCRTALSPAVLAFDIRDLLLTVCIWRRRQHLLSILFRINSRNPGGEKFLYLSWQMLRSTQTILWFYWKAAPKYECYKGHAGTDKKNKIFYRLSKNFDMWINNRLLYKSNPTGSSPRSRLFITKKRSSHGVIIILADCEWICALLFLSPISHPLTLLSRSTSDAAADSGLHQTQGTRLAARIVEFDITGLSYL